MSEEEDRSDEEEPTTSDEEFIDDGSEDESSESSDEDGDSYTTSEGNVSIWMTSVWNVTMTIERYRALVRMEKELLLLKKR